MGLCDCSQHTLHYETLRAEICYVDQTKTVSFGGKDRIK